MFWNIKSHIQYICNGLTERTFRITDLFASHSTNGVQFNWTRRLCWLSMHHSMMFHWTFCIRSGQCTAIASSIAIVWCKLTISKLFARDSFFESEVQINMQKNCVTANFVSERNIFEPWKRIRSDFSAVKSADLFAFAFMYMYKYSFTTHSPHWIGELVCKGAESLSERVRKREGER